MSIPSLINFRQSKSNPLLENHKAKTKIFITVFILGHQNYRTILKPGSKKITTTRLILS